MPEIMNANELLTNLNQEQQRAVITDSQYTLVLAGAGSGKTRVVVHRIAWLCSVKNIPSGAIFAVTFTNKAVSGMQERIKELLDEAHYQGIWVSTFHGAAHRLLRIFSKEAGLPDNFKLIDMDDQIRLLKRLMQELNLDEEAWSPKQAAKIISSQKEKGLRADDITDDMRPIELKIYALYQQICEQAGYVDFSELLLRTHELLKRDQKVLNYCRCRFRYIFVDEFQDANPIQLNIIKLLAGKKNNIMIVGDDDQSIYGWRDVNADNLQNFVREYPGTNIIRLEQNYRSTAAILHVANHLIIKNQQRLGKNLWTHQKNGEFINIYMGFNDIDEARFVANQIKKHHISGGDYSNCAILYRNNALSRLIEDTLIQAGIPYQIYGSIRLYERQEAKKALAYLRLLHDPQNDMAFEQVINAPARGIGEVSLNTIRKIAKQQQCSLWNTAKTLLSSNIIKSQPKAGLIRFIELIETMTNELNSLPFYQQLSRIIYDSGLYEMYQQEQGIKAQSRLENLKKLLEDAERFYEKNGNEIIDPLSGKTLTALDAFLGYTVLEDKEDQQKTKSVQLMTLHSAKGLEFDNVYIVGMEEGLFPNERAKSDDKQMEEERRLMYVGITRARKQLTLSFCQLRRLYGREERKMPSRFLKELPKEWLSNGGYLRNYSITPVTLNNENIQVKSASKNCQKTKTTNKKPHTVAVHLGQRVRHYRFGEGTIINMDGEADHQRVQVAFINEGIKWLVLKLANLELI